MDDIRSGHKCQKLIHKLNLFWRLLRLFGSVCLGSCRSNSALSNPDIDESPLPDEKPETLVRRLSIAKARAVVSRAPAALIIGSDQVAVHRGKIVGKPRDHADAVAQLLSSSGKTITFFTSVALLNSANGSLQTE